MLTIGTIIGFALAVTSLIVLLFPKKKDSLFIKRSCWVIITVGILCSIFNSNQYLHWKHFDEKKVNIQFQQLPHVFGIDNNIVHEYVLGIENKYSSSDIKQIELEVNSRMPVLDSQLLLSDCDEKSLDVKIQNASSLIVKTNLLRRGQVIWLSFRCKALNRNNLPEDITLVLMSTPIKLSYQLYNVAHEIIVDSGVNVKLSNKKYFEKDILFKKIVAIDHRKAFTEKTAYQYCQFSFDNSMQSISVFRTHDDFLSVIHAGLKGTLKYKSKSKINLKTRTVDIVRLVVFKNDFFLIEGTFEFTREV